MNPIGTSDPSRKKPHWVIVGTLATFGVLLLFIGIKERAQADPQTEQPLEVETTTPKRQALQYEVVQSGTLKPYEEVAIHSKVAGFVEQWYMDIGDRVKKGDMLAKLALPELEKATQIKLVHVAIAQTKIKLAKSDETVAKALTENGEALKNEAMAEIKRAEILHTRWEHESAREKENAKNGIPNEQIARETEGHLQDALAILNKAKAQLVTVQTALKVQKAHLEKAANEVELAQANLEVAKGDYEVQRAWLDYTTLRAPFDGIITSRNVNTGDFVTVPTGANESNSAKPLFVLMRVDLIRAVFFVNEDQALLVKNDARAIVRFPALHDRELAGRVTRTSIALDSSNQLRVEVYFENAKQELFPGMSAIARIQADASNALTLPAKAILSDGKVKYCYFLETGKAARRDVKVGRSGQGLVEILAKERLGGKPLVEWSDWTGHERIITSNLDSIKDGQAVKEN